MRYLSFVLVFLFSFVIAQRTGSEVYQNLCVVCHQSNGEGTVITGGLLAERFHSTRETGLGLNAGFPPLAENAGNILQHGGRKYLIDVLLFGLEGQIKVGEQTYDGIMPAWGNLSNEELANVLKYILSNWSEDLDFTVEGSDFERARAQAKDPSDNCQTRESLGFGCKITRSK